MLGMNGKGDKMDAYLITVVTKFHMKGKNKDQIFNKLIGLNYELIDNADSITIEEIFYDN